jgi:signal transduction histidine kinase
MWEKASLRFRILVIVIALVAVTVGGGVIMIWYTYRVQALFGNILARNVAAFQAAEALETALVNQKGFVTYYLMDGNPEWLRQLGEYRQIFRQRFEEVRSLVETDLESAAVDLIDSQYERYVDLKDQVIEHYRKGDREKGGELHRLVRDHFSKILALCERYKTLHRNGMQAALNRSQVQAERLRIIALSAVIAAFLLAGILTFVLMSHVLGPIRRLALEADREGGPELPDNEVKALSRSVRGLIEDVDQTQFQLAKSRESLLQAEKMALVGKLAAGTAHSIRNPLTSVKMRLFSLSRSLQLSSTQKEDFDVISDEIRHVDTIVQNFLEFSRPPKLKMQEISPSDVVDMAIELLKHRLQSYGVDVTIVRPHRLPGIQVDAEQLKEAIVNLVVNACEAMEGGGHITIQEDMGSAEPLGRVAYIRVKDDGPGIPEAIREKVLQPFFTTKEEGTGLGLSIVARIVEQHGGWLDLTSKEGEGTTFVITLPVEERAGEQRSHHR